MPDLSGFHFLRPAWLLALAAVPVLFLVLRTARGGDSGWARWIPAPLLSPLVRRGRNGTSATPAALAAAVLAWTLLAVALAGPAWREAPTPLKQPGDSLVMVLDLSLSMLATDVEPDRLTRAKRKIRDILAERADSLNALVVFAADAHVVTPLTDDRRTIENMLEVLDPAIMPAQGNRADRAIALARTLLDQGAPGAGRILLITDDVNDRYWPAIDATLDTSRFSLSTLVVGTEQGGPIPLAKRGFIRDNGNVVITRADRVSLAELAQRHGGLSHPLTLDNTDIRQLRLAPDDSNDWQSVDSTSTVNRWQDDGYWLLWLAAPLLLLGWRRGVLAGLALTLLPLAPEPALADSWEALWLREDQRAPALIEDDPARAARELSSPQWQATALYRAGQYREAARLYETLAGPEAAYNRGNALARAGELEAALAAYDKALAQMPEHEDARFNRKLVEELLEQQQQSDQNGQPQGQPSDQNGDDRNRSDSQSNGDSDDGQEAPESTSPNSQPSPSDQGGDGQNQQAQGNTDDSGTNNGDSPEPESPQSQSGATGERSDELAPGQSVEAPEELTETPLTQGQEQWLRRVPDNPGGLLRRKFLQQYQQRQTPSDEGDTPW